MCYRLIVYAPTQLARPNGRCCMTSLKSYVRSLMVHAPALQDMRSRVGLEANRLLRRLHDEDWRAFEQLRLPPGPILDIGANRGQSIVSFRTVMPGCSIDAFEPNPVVSERLSRRHKHDPGIHIHAIALSDVGGRFDLHVPRYRNWMFDGLASLDRAEAFGWLNPERMAGFNPDLLTLVTFEVDVLPLDDLDLHPSVMKLDTQGTELQVLRGGLKTIASAGPVILVENPPVAITDLLAPLGYRPFTYDGQTFHAHKGGSKNVFYLTDAHFTS